MAGVFCIGLFLVSTLAGLDGSQYQHAKPVFDRFPSLKTAVMFENLGWAFVLIYGFIVGCIVRNGSPLRCCRFDGQADSLKSAVRKGLELLGSAVAEGRVFAVVSVVVDVLGRCTSRPRSNPVVVIFGHFQFRLERAETRIP